MKSYGFSVLASMPPTFAAAIITIVGSFGSLFAIMFFSDVYPLNLVLVAIFSGFIGWSMGPTVSALGENFKMRKYKKKAGLLSKTVVTKKTTAMERFFGDKALAIFVKVPDMSTLSSRLKDRGTETPESLQKRIDKAAYEMSFEDQFDVTIVNDDLEESLPESENLYQDFLAK